MKGTVEYYLVKVVRPHEVSTLRMARHIRDSVRSWGGGYSPDDPLFGKQDCTVRRFPMGSTLTLVDFTHHK